MAKVLTGISGNLISAASAGFAPTNSADVSAIASAYQVVSATATQLYAGTAYVTSVNGTQLSASRAGNAANASMASSAYYDGTGRLISALPDSAAVSSIASAYAESAASGKQDTLSFSYDDGKISAINGSALAGQGGGGGGSVVSPSGTIIVTDGSAIETTNSAIGTAEDLDVNNSGQALYAFYPNTYTYLGYYSTFNAIGIGLTYNSSTATRTAWVSAVTNLGTLVSSFVLPASSISAGGLLSTSNIESILASNLKVDGGSLTLSGSYPVLFVSPGVPYSAVKELAWKEEIPSIGIYENIYKDKYISSIDNIPVSAKWAGSANYTYTASQDPNGRYLTALPDASSIPTGVTSPSGTIVTNGFSVEATNSAVTTVVVTGYAPTVVGWVSQVSPYSPLVCTLPSANEKSQVVISLDWGGDTGTASAVFDGITATATASNRPVDVVLDVPNATSVSIYYSDYRTLVGSASASAADYLAPGIVAELAWASALPTYSYDSEDKISAINGSAIAGGAGGVDSATVSAIASAYVESGVSGKLDASASSSFYTTANESGFITGVDLSNYATTGYVDSSVSGKLDASASSSFYTTANESGFITGVDLSPYQTTADMSSYIPTSMSSDFQQVTGMSSYVPYSSIGYNTASAISGINGSALAGTTYSAGTGIDITDDVISVETPVDIVAGPGIVIDNPDGNTLRVSMAQEYDKVLWSGTAATSANVSESIFNFERCRMVIQENDATNTVAECEFEIVQGTTTYDVIALYYGGASNPFQMETAPVTITNDGTTVSIGTVVRRYFPASTGAGGSDSNTGKMTKVVGIHRIANN